MFTADHATDRRRSREGRAPVAEAMERRARRGAHHAAAARATASPIAASNSDALVGGHGEGLRRADLDDLQAGAGARRRMSARASTARSSSMPTRITRTETDEDTGEEMRARHPLHERLHRVQRRADRRPAAAFHARREPPRSITVQRIERAEELLRRDRRRDPARRQPGLLHAWPTTTCSMPPFETFRDAESYYATLAHEMHALDAASNRASTATSAASAGAMKAMRWRSWSPNWRGVPLRRSRSHAGAAR